MNLSSNTELIKLIIRYQWYDITTLTRLYMCGNKYISNHVLSNDICESDGKTIRLCGIIQQMRLNTLVLRNITHIPAIEQTNLSKLSNLTLVINGYNLWMTLNQSKCDYHVAFPLLKSLCITYCEGHLNNDFYKTIPKTLDSLEFILSTYQRQIIKISHEIFPNLIELNTNVEIDVHGAPKHFRKLKCIDLTDDERSNIYDQLIDLTINDYVPYNKFIIKKLTITNGYNQYICADDLPKTLVYLNTVTKINGNEFPLSLEYLIIIAEINIPLPPRLKSLCASEFNFDCIPKSLQYVYVKGYTVNAKICKKYQRITRTVVKGSSHYKVNINDRLSYKSIY